MTQYDTVWFINNPAYGFIGPSRGDTAKRKRRVIRQLPTPQAETNLEHRDLQFYIWLAMQAMRPRERKIAVLYYGLDGGESMTMEQIGELLGISGGRVQQVLLRGRRRIYHSRAGRLLQDMWGVYDGPFSGIPRPKPKRRALRLSEYTYR